MCTPATQHRRQKGGAIGASPPHVTEGGKIETELIKLDRYSLIEQSNYLIEQPVLEVLEF